jgi:rRNA maturation protein Nop10
MNDPKPARPWDLFNRNIGRVGESVKESRMEICRECEFFTSLTQTCKKCGCIMPAKAGLPHAFCPIHKWDAVDTSGVGFTEE